MKLFVVAALVLVADALSVKEEWQRFKMDHGKTYKSLREEKFRFSIFQDNLQVIHEHNEKYDKGEVTYAMKITQFTDMTDQELLNLLKPQRGTIPAGEKFVSGGGEIPKSKDWRKEGAVTAVKNQGDKCGSSWAFSATGAIEGQLFRKNGTLISLSEQNLIDCDLANFGCWGGYVNNAFNYSKVYGITTEDGYPYEAKQGTCHQKGHPTVSVNDYVEIEVDEKLITEALATVGPISVQINASPSLFKYSHGIIDESSCNDNVNHYALLVGYGEEAGVPYYIVKNSWGAKWGEQGYFRLKRNVEACGVDLSSYYPKF